MVRWSVAFFAGQFDVGVGQPKVHLWMLERFDVLPLPGRRVDEREFGAVVFGMALGAFRFFGLRQKVMVAQAGV